jgi:hypothetical protein
MEDPELTLTFSRLLMSVKREEHSRIQIKPSFLVEEDQATCELLGDFDKEKPVFAEINILKLIKIEDWFKDGTTIVKTFRKGRGRNPYTDSTVTFRMEVLRNGEKVLSNYPELQPVMYLPEEYK